jgi:4-hydroxyphenylacetate 3-monooxygenase
MLARLYDALHLDDRKSVLCTETDTGSGGFTHRFYRATRNAEELVGARDAIAEWARLTYGWMGRSPDYKASFLATLGANSEFYKPFEENARRWYKKVQEEVSFVNHAIVNPPVDRNKELAEVRDVYMHVEKETDGGPSDEIELDRADPADQSAGTTGHRCRRGADRRGSCGYCQCRLRCERRSPA